MRQNTYHKVNKRIKILTLCNERKSQREIIKIIDRSRKLVEMH